METTSAVMPPKITPKIEARKVSACRAAERNLTANKWRQYMGDRPYVKTCPGFPLHPTPTGAACPIADPHWAKGGCTTTVATGAGARVRVQLDRDSATYKAIYAQRTMTERINSQAQALGIERPKLRNQQSITNANTLIYVLINLRVYQRIRARQSTARPEVVPPVTG